MAGGPGGARLARTCSFEPRTFSVDSKRASPTLAYLAPAKDQVLTPLELEKNARAASGEYACKQKSQKLDWAAKMAVFNTATLSGQGCDLLESFWSTTRSNQKVNFEADKTYIIGAQASSHSVHCESNVTIHLSACPLKIQCLFVFPLRCTHSSIYCGT